MICSHDTPLCQVTGALLRIAEIAMPPTIHAIGVISIISRTMEAEKYSAVMAKTTRKFFRPSVAFGGNSRGHMEIALPIYASRKKMMPRLLVDVQKQRPLSAYSSFRMLDQ